MKLKSLLKFNLPPNTVNSLYCLWHILHFLQVSVKNNFDWHEGKCSKIYEISNPPSDPTLPFEFKQLCVWKKKQLWSSIVCLCVCCFFHGNTRESESLSKVHIETVENGSGNFPLYGEMSESQHNTGNVSHCICSLDPWGTRWLL